MNPKNKTARLALLTGLSTLLLSVPAMAFGNKAVDNGDCGSNADVCETREFTLKAKDQLIVDATANGGIHVEGWDRGEIRIRAKVRVDADGDEDRAKEIARKIVIATDGEVKATGPRRKSWSVSYDIMVPHETDLDLVANNGGIAVHSVEGQMELKTTNGGLHLSALSGEVHGRTINGGLDIQLSGSEWSGKGLDAKSTNGGVRLRVPDDYSAELSLSTVNGGLHIDFPVMVSGNINKKINATLGEGGAPIRVATTNGGVQVYRD